MHPPVSGLYNPQVNRSSPPGAKPGFLPAFLLFLATLPGPAAERPSLPELPLGTGSASFAGGGAAHASGLNSIFDNPAALSVPDAFQAEGGLMGLSAGLSPYLLFGARTSETSAYAIGYFYDMRPGDPGHPTDPRQGMVAGASWKAGSRASLGGSVRSVGTGSGVGLDGFGVDGDAGALFRPWNALWTGLSVRNLLESGAGQEPAGYETHRSYALALGTGLSALRFAGITLHDPDAYYELRASGTIQEGRASHAFSLASAFTPGGKLGFRGTFLLPQGGSPGFAVGTFLNLPFGRNALRIAYTFHAGGFEETGEAAASHSISLNFRLGGKLDPIPPMVEVVADSVLVRPADGEGPRVHFRLSASDKTYSHGHSEEDGSPDEPLPSSKGGWADRKAAVQENHLLSSGRIQEWSLVICAVGADGLAGTEMKAYRGKDLPPRVIRWDADDAAGRRVPAGFYAFRLEALDMAGNKGGTAWQILEIRDQRPVSGD
ncbi:MAG: hypothetical protein JWP91_1730 [Fibrobacteres bacterium]|nr:hypothetical protein [Fibrobacterota bacterium]